MASHDTYEDCERYIYEQLEQAPPVLTDALAAGGPFGDLESCEEAFRAAIPLVRRSAPEWAGTAHCLYAGTLKEMENHLAAIEHAGIGKELGLNLVGQWFYFDVMEYCLNQLDRLDEALQIADQAIKFFEQNGLEGFHADHLSRKANVLKQMAAPLSRDPAGSKEAKALITQALYAICKSLSINKTEWKSQEEEFKHISRIAARVGVTADDLGFLDSMDDVRDLVNPYMGTTSLPRRSAAQLYNLAIEAIKKNDRALAVRYYADALSLTREDNPEDRAFKAFLAYQYGVCLLKMNRLEVFDPSTRLSAAGCHAIVQIQALWNTTRRLFSSLDPELIGRWDQRFPPGLTDAVGRIEQDPWMQMKEKHLNALALMDQGQFREAIVLLKHALDEADGSDDIMFAAATIVEAYLSGILKKQRPRPGTREFEEIRNHIWTVMRVFDIQIPQFKAFYSRAYPIESMRELLQWMNSVAPQKDKG